MGNKIFILGTGRCGTVTINNVLNTVSNTISIHEGVFYDQNGNKKILGHLKEINKYIYYENNNPFEIKKRYLQTYKLNNINNFNFLDSFFERRNNFIESLGDKNYCDVNPYGYMFINFIVKKYPDAKFVHLVRDGRAVVKSYYDRKNSLGINTSYPEGVLEEDYTSWYAGKPRPIIGSKEYNLWPNYNRVQKLSWFWNFVNLEIEKRLKNINEKNKYFIRLEDLNEKNIKKMLNFFNLPITFDLRSLEADNIGKKSSLNWDEENLKLFNNINKNLMKKYGYK